MRTDIAKAVLALLALAALPAPAIAQATSTGTWPQRSIRLIVPFPAGSATDVAVRILEQAMTPRLGQSLVVDNRSGASGSIGVDAVAKAEPDGYTSGLITVSTHAVAPALGRKLPYDPLADFAPLGMIGSTPYALVAYPGLGAGTIAELVALAKAKPGSINYGSAGPASMAHLAAALLATRTGTEMVHVPYRSSAHSVTDIIAGRIQIQFATIPPSQELIATAKLRALAVSSAQRSPALPDVPTVAKSGLPDFEATLWMALVMPARTPPQIVQRFNTALVATLSDPKTRHALLVQGLEVEPGNPDAVVARIRTDIAKWREVIQKAGIKAE